MLVCARCGKRLPDDTPLWRCDCGGPLDYAFETVPSFDDAELVAGAPNFWRYGAWLGLHHPERAASLGEVMTPLIELDWKGRPVLFKLDHLQPTGSYKDRGTAVMAAHLKETGQTEIVEDSSGNAGSSLAAYCAASGIDCHVFVPQSTSEGKCLQIGAYGARIHRVPGSREDTTAAAEAMGATHYYSSHNWNPWFALGVRTWAFEVWEQMGHRAPGGVIVPVGQGSLALGAARAFGELKAAGRIEVLPRIYAVQSANCAPLATAFQAGDSEPATIIKRPTLAEGIASAAPVRGFQVLKAVRDSGGSFVTVTETSIVDSFTDLARRGLFLEPTSCVVGAALDSLIASGELTDGETVVVLSTGTGLKAASHLDELLALRTTC